MRFIVRLIPAGLLLTFLLPQPVYAEQLKETKRVLVLHSEDKANPAHELTDVGINWSFRSNTLFDVQLYIEYLDGSRFSSPAHTSAMVDYLNRKYTGTKIDSIIAVYPRAVNFLMQEAGKVFPGVPIVASEIDRGTAENLERSPWRSLVTGVILGDNVADLLKIAFRLRPGTKRVALVAGAAPTDAYGETMLRNGLKPYEEKIGLIDLTKLPMQEILDRVRSLPPDTIVLYSSIFKDGAGKIFVPREALSLISTAANGPTFNPYDGTIGYGNVGGRLISFDLQGREAAALALRIMNGESPSSIPFGGERAYVDLYDGRELKRWNIPESAVPPDSEIRNRMPSTWEEHREAIIGGIVLIMIESFLILGLVINLRRRRRAEQFLSESEERLSLAAASANAGLWSLSEDTGQVWATDKIRELFGFPPHVELNYEDVLRMIHSEDRKRVQQTVQQAMQSGEDIVIEYRILLADGSIRWIASRGRLQPTKAGKPRSMMGVSVDITERKHSEDELKEAYLEIRKLKDRLEAESAYLQEEIHAEHNFENIVGRSNALKYVLYRVEQVAATDSTVLILGETGTGKELIARAIHSTGKRRGRALIKVNCATLPANLIESELFGHEKGAFTGATTKKLGRFELAHQATLFLDEIGELSLDLQSKLLRVIEEGEFERLGSSKTIKVNLRVIAATNRNLEKEMKAGRFREDLWYRLNVFTITVPPLRERPEDIPLLAKHFMEFFNKAFGKALNKIPTRVVESLQHYQWPGNVRELKHVIERATINSTGDTLQLAEALVAPAIFPSSTSDNSGAVSFLSLEEMVRKYILRVLEKVGWKIAGKGGAAEILEINPDTLRSRMRKLGIRKTQ